MFDANVSTRLPTVCQKYRVPELAVADGVEEHPTGIDSFDQSEQCSTYRVGNASGEQRGRGGGQGALQSEHSISGFGQAVCSHRQPDGHCDGAGGEHDDPNSNTEPASEEHPGCGTDETGR